MAPEFAGVRGDRGSRTLNRTPRRWRSNQRLGIREPVHGLRWSFCADFLEGARLQPFLEMAGPLPATVEDVLEK